ncbi:hypothetical protein LIER_34204 [Lithospermum erythrorhizon]|uniref:Uncharacterized protein n=1 Tax=Lithospermum erythrorhizon TaxID=34254 RepID=A0AAV3S3C2_LITER
MPFTDQMDSVALPSRFKLLQFNLFDGNGNPLKHLKGFIAHMTITSNNPDVFSNVFPNRLTEKALDWGISEACGNKKRARICYQASVFPVNKSMTENRRKRCRENQLEIRIVRKGEDEDNLSKEKDNQKRPIPHEEVEEIAFNPASKE